MKQGWAKPPLNLMVLRIAMNFFHTDMLLHQTIEYLEQEEAFVL